MPFLSLSRFCLAMTLFATSATVSATAPAYAEVPRVATDIAPVQSLVATVMQGLGTPDLIVTPGASPHGYAMRPSQAQALQTADLVVWVGPALTPWLMKPIETLAPHAAKLELLSAPGTQIYPFREAHEHEHEDEHGEEGEHGDEHDDDHDAIDPHAWLDPQNGQIWLGVIANQLAQVDPENAAQYRANALIGQKELAAQQVALAALLAPMQGRGYVTFHDAYQYFETRFGLTPTGAVAFSDASDPSPAALARLQLQLLGAGVTCAFSEPQFDPGLLEAISDGALTIRSLDPMGSRLIPGPDLYQKLLQDMGGAFAACTP